MLHIFVGVSKAKKTKMAKDFYSETGTFVVPAATTTAAEGALSNTSNIVIGTDLNLLKAGDWILDIANGERRQVVKVDSDTQLTISKEFSNATANAVLDIVKAEACAAVYMSLSGSGIVVDGVTTDFVEFGNSNAGGSTTKFIRPRFVTGATVVNIQYFDNTYPD